MWRYPDFLIIILKRFVYLERGPGGVAGSVKLDNRVEFPLQDLDLNPYLSGMTTRLILTVRGHKTITYFATFRQCCKFSYTGRI